MARAAPVCWHGRGGGAPPATYCMYVPEGGSFACLFAGCAFRGGAPAIQGPPANPGAKRLHSRSSASLVGCSLYSPRHSLRSPSHTHDCKNVYRRMVSPPHGGAARRSRLSAPRSKGDFYRACQVCGSTSDSGQRADARGAARTSRPILLIRGADAVGVQYVRLYYTGNVTDCNQPDCAKSAKHMHKTATTCFCTQVSLRVCCAAAADARVAGIHRQTSRTKLHADEV